MRFTQTANGRSWDLMAETEEDRRFLEWLDRTRREHESIHVTTTTSDPTLPEGLDVGEATLISKS